MKRISISQAWSYATSFFNGQMAAHAIILIGFGIVVPLILQFIFTGGAMVASANGSAGANGGAALLAAMGGGLFFLSLASYVLQTGSYFASWRIGLTGGKDGIGPAIGFGLVAALPVLLLTIAFVIVLGLFAFLIFGSAMLPMLMGGQPSAAQSAGAAGLVLLAMPVFLFFMLWLAARFCCMGPVMADRGTYNVLTGLGESWRLTAASQWKIMGYLVLLIIVVMVIALIVVMVAGVSLFAAGGGGISNGSIAGIFVASLLAGIPMAYLQVAVPAGIYRALDQGKVSDVFA